MTPRLIIFDADGTLCDRDSRAFLPGVETYLNRLRHEHDRPAVAIATNQGGVGCRVGFGGFGHPERYPTEASALADYRALARHVGARLYVCFAYQAKSGEWSVAPPNALAPEYWRRDWRKPAPGMLLQAMRDARVSPRATLMVGDRDEDKRAAAAASCAFRWAADFFQGGGV